MSTGTTLPFLLPRLLHEACRNEKKGMTSRDMCGPRGLHYDKGNSQGGYSGESTITPAITRKQQNRNKEDAFK
jgi:hypothetical protein